MSEKLELIAQVLGKNPEELISTLSNIIESSEKMKLIKLRGYDARLVVVFNYFSAESVKIIEHAVAGDFVDVYDEDDVYEDVICIVQEVIDSDKFMKLSKVLEVDEVPQRAYGHFKTSCWSRDTLE